LQPPPRQPTEEKERERLSGREKGGPVEWPGNGGGGDTTSRSSARGEERQRDRGVRWLGFQELYATTTTATIADQGLVLAWGRSKSGRKGHANYSSREARATTRRRFRGPKFSFNQPN